MLLRVGDLPEAALDAAARFHQNVLPHVRMVLGMGPGALTLVFAPADHTHRGWRLAVVQSLARECTPVRVNAVEADTEDAIAAADAYLEQAQGVTGQLLPLDGLGAGKVI